MLVNNFYRHILDGLFPNDCALCGLPSHRPTPLCLPCETEIPLNSHCCQRCAIPLPEARAHSAALYCGQCLHSPPPFDRVIAPWLYSEQLAHLIHRWKYGKQQQLTTLLASLWRQQVPRCPRVDVLVPVPLHWRRRWLRGFNQAGLLGHRLRATCPELRECRVADRLVRRRRATASQSGIGARQRSRNLRGAFTVREPCDNLRLAIVDDVLTTGATAAVMAQALRAAGASHIEVWCLARTAAPGS